MTSDSSLRKLYGTSTKREKVYSKAGSQHEIDLNPFAPSSLPVHHRKVCNSLVNGELPGQLLNSKARKNAYASTLTFTSKYLHLTHRPSLAPHPIPTQAQLLSLVSPKESRIQAQKATKYTLYNSGASDSHSSSIKLAQLKSSYLNDIYNKNQFKVALPKKLQKGAEGGLSTDFCLLGDSLYLCLLYTSPSPRD
eukprot:TRINITY_DN3919_c0_g1_i10.p1 TRINITY_DN3919_c0_g1~~TRINITY_DN3919_c0_g1_i10.p1  ORF type:complete len:194 (-),score=25.72 TRINITY_DN3919_c0_g1_i10:53-634(-)